MDLKSSSPFTADTPCELNVFNHHCHPFCVNRAQSGILKHAHHESFRSFLKSWHSRRLESEVWFVLSSDFTNQSLERQLANQKLRWLLVFSNLSECHCSRSEPVWLLYPSSSRRVFPRSFISQMLPWGFRSGILSCCLLIYVHWLFDESVSSFSCLLLF